MDAERALATGRRAQARGDWRRARVHYQAALAERPTADVLEALGWVGWWLADEALTFGSREQAYRLHREAGRAADAARVALWLAADFREFRGDPATGRGWLERSRRLLEDEPASAEHGWLELTEADFALNVEHDPERAISRARRAAGLGREHGVPDLEAVGLALEGVALVGGGVVPPGMRRLEEAVAIASGEPMQLPLSLGWTLCCALSACERVGDFERARRWCDATRRFAERWGGRQLLGVCRTAYGRILAINGDWPRAESELLAAVDDMESARPGLAGPGLARLGELRARQGRTAEARALLERAGVAGLTGLGQLALDAGDPDSAAEAAERVLRRLPADAVLDRLPALELLARALAGRGELDAAGALWRTVRDAAAAVGTPFASGRCALLAAELAVARGAWDDARRAAEDAIDCFAECCAPYEAAVARLRRAEALRALGRGPAAGREAELAREAFRALGARRDLERLAQPGGDGADLTPRELEVLRLVAHGMSDAEIAERLIVSPHTVHRHVANIRVKLALPSRAAAVAHATRAGLL
jgi:DNA-binding CsgD family transcriptional regulator